MLISLIFITTRLSAVNELYGILVIPDNKNRRSSEEPAFHKAQGSAIQCRHQLVGLRLIGHESTLLTVPLRVWNYMTLNRLIRAPKMLA